MISWSSSFASSTPATSLNVTFFCELDDSFALLLPNDSALLPPLCIWRMKKIQKPIISRIGRPRVEQRRPRAGRRLLRLHDDAALDQLVDEAFVLRRARRCGSCSLALVTPVISCPVIDDARDLPGVDRRHELAEADRLVALLELRREVPDQHADDDEHHPEHQTLQRRVHAEPPTDSLKSQDYHGLRGVRHPKLLVDRVPGHPHNPVRLVDHERHAVAALRGPLSGPRRSPAASSARRARAAGTGRPAAGSGPPAARAAVAAAPRAHVALAVPALPGVRAAAAASSADTTQPASASATSPGIDSGYRKRFADSAAARRPAVARPAYSLRRRSAPTRSTRWPGRVDRGPPPRLEQRERRLDVVERHRPPAGRPRSSRAARRAGASGQRRRASASASSAPDVAARVGTIGASTLARRPPSIHCHSSRASVGLVGQHVDDRRVEPRLEQRQQLGAHAVARNADVVVRLVVDVTRRRARARYARSSARRQSSSGRMTAPRRGCIAARPRGAGAAQQAQQERLGLIVPRVAERDDVGAEVHARALEERVARRARGVLERPPLAPRARAPTSSRSTRNGQPSDAATPRAEALVVVGRRPQLMIEVRDAGEPQLARRVRARAAGARARPSPTRPTAATTTRVSGPREIVLPDGPPDAVEQLHDRAGAATAGQCSPCPPAAEPDELVPEGGLEPPTPRL